MGAYLTNLQLNEQQLDRIRLFRRPLPEEYFIQIKRLAIHWSEAERSKVAFGESFLNNMSTIM